MIEPSFFTWMQWAFPIVLVMLPVMGFVTDDQIRTLQLPGVGKWRFEEIATLPLSVTALLWVTRKGPMGGWSGAQIPDASVALWL